MKNAARMLAVLALSAVCCAPLAGCSSGGGDDGSSGDDGRATGAVNEALDEAGRALDEARDSVGAALSGVGESVDAALDEAAATLDAALADLSTNFQESLDTVRAELGRTTEVEVVDARDGSTVATVTDEDAISQAFSAPDYASWRLADAAPAESDARYILRCMQSSVGLLDSGEMHETLTLTTYEGGYLGIAVFGGGTLAMFEVPQADVDAFEALAE